MRIGIDLGGTKIEGIAIDGDGRERLRRRIASPRGDYAHTLERGRRPRARDRAGDRRDRHRRRRDSRHDLAGDRADQELELDLAERHGRWRRICRALLDRPVRFANDANCFALSEATDGAAAGARVVFGVIIGTGTGGGVVIDRQVLVGANAIGGEWGHNPLPGRARRRVAGPGLLLRPQRLHRDVSVGAGAGARLRRARREDDHRGGGRGAGGRRATRWPTRRSARYEDRMARALGSVINLLDPDVIVLGGGLSNIDRLYDSVPRLWSPYIFSDAVVTRLVRAQHGDSSGVRGAAWLWNEKMEPQRSQRPQSIDQGAAISTRPSTIHQLRAGVAEVPQRRE